LSGLESAIDTLLNGPSEKNTLDHSGPRSIESNAQELVDDNAVVEVREEDGP